jgi:hypothetical protein
MVQEPFTNPSSQMQFGISYRLMSLASSPVIRLSSYRLSISCCSYNPCLHITPLPHHKKYIKKPGISARNRYVRLPPKITQILCERIESYGVSICSLTIYMRSCENMLTRKTLLYPSRYLQNYTLKIYRKDSNLHLLHRSSHCLLPLHTLPLHEEREAKCNAADSDG